MNTMQLSCFVEVASTLSFSKAAEHLHVSQPTVSHQVRSLESELGCSLLVRSTRTVRLTDEGFTFISYAHEMLDLERRAKRRFREGSEGEAHWLRLGVQDGYEARMVTGGLRALGDEDPDLRPVLRQAPASVLLNMLEAGIVDVMPDVPEDGGDAGPGRFVELGRARVCCACAPSHPLAARGEGSVGLEELVEAGAVVFANPHRCAPAVAAVQQAILPAKAQEDVVAGAGPEVVLALAEAGVGFALVLDVPSMRLPGLRYLPVAGSEPAPYGVRVASGRESATVSRFIELVRETAS